MRWRKLSGSPPGIERGESRTPTGHDAPFGQDSRPSIPMVTALRYVEPNRGGERRPSGRRRVGSGPSGTTMSTHLHSRSAGLRAGSATGTGPSLATGEGAVRIDGALCGHHCPGLAEPSACSDVGPSRRGAHVILRIPGRALLSSTSASRHRGTVSLGSRQCLSSRSPWWPAVEPKISGRRHARFPLRAFASTCGGGRRVPPAMLPSRKSGRDNDSYLGG